MQDFTQLTVWQEAHALALEIYRLTRPFPVEERFGLTSQLRRAAVSIAANIAEGSRRRRQNDYARFLNIAEGSLAETECLLLVARDLGLVLEEEASSYSTRASSLGRRLNALRQRIESSPDR